MLPKSVTCVRTARHEFENDMNLFEWMSQWRQKGDDEHASCAAVLGQLLFSKDDSNKSVHVISGGEEGAHAVRQAGAGEAERALAWTSRRTTWTWSPSKSLNLALENYPGTLVFVSHDQGIRVLTGDPHP
jgi:ATPase subunit of ABC transporter with duplicated ATPase domains